MDTLFEQIGLTSNDSSINQFIRTHTLFSHKIRLNEATFWTADQAHFLKESLNSDSGWSEVVDELNLKLHS